MLPCNTKAIFKAQEMYFMDQTEPKVTNKRKFQSTAKKKLFKPRGIFLARGHVIYEADVGNSALFGAQFIFSF